MNPLDKIINIVRTLKEEGGPTMAMGNGQIAGSSEAGDNPPVRKKNKKRYIFQRNTRKNWKK
jgi:hypothetical protein|tara:strand:- start:154 stop:339 length:186 start_codon:yes stop_codon:yes gene_type:complete